ncbi:MAG: VCBS repeat-containing protein [Planctomycetota bacterium]
MRNLDALSFFAGLSLFFATWLPAQHVLLETAGQVGGERRGASLAVVGDLDGDGFSDFLLGTSHNRVDLVSGGDGSLIQSFFGDSPGDDFGVSVVALGDVDFDGFGDFAIGASQRSSGGAGYVRVFSGGPRLALYTHGGNMPGDRFGETLALLGDVSQNGIPDFGVGAPTAEHGGNQVGDVTVYDGLTGFLVHSLVGIASGDFFGTAMTGPGDLDGDGFDDILVGAPIANVVGGSFFGGFGGVYLYSGLSGNLLSQWAGDNPDDAFGASLAALGDADFDGVAEFAVGMPGFDQGGFNAGAVRILQMNGPAIQTIVGSSAQARFGSVLADAVDLNGDLVPEMFIGSPDYSGVAPASGRLEVFTPLLQANFWQIDGDVVFGNMGAAFCAADFDGDGLIEVAVAEPGAGSPLASGRVRVFGVERVLGPAAQSRVEDLGGDREDVLFVNGSAGGGARRVDLSPLESFQVEVAQPSANATPARFVLFGVIARPRFHDAFPLPLGLGAMAFPPCALLPSAEPTLFVVADTIGGMACTPLVVASPAPWSVLAGGIAFSASYTLQAVIEEQPGQLKVSNGILIRVL